MLGILKRYFRSSKLDSLPMQSEEDREQKGLNTTLMREFYTLIGDATDIDVTFEDADCFYEGLGDEEPSLKRLKALSDTDYKNILTAAQRILESNQITEQHLRDIVRITVSHWDREK